MRRHFVLVLFTAAVVGACGQTGPLYLPKEEPAVEPKAEAAAGKPVEPNDAVKDSGAAAQEGDAEVEQRSRLVEEGEEGQEDAKP